MLGFSLGLGLGVQAAGVCSGLLVHGSGLGVSIFGFGFRVLGVGLLVDSSSSSS